MVVVRWKKQFFRRRESVRVVDAQGNNYIATREVRAKVMIRQSTLFRNGIPTAQFNERRAAVSETRFTYLNRQTPTGRVTYRSFGRRTIEQQSGRLLRA